MISSIKSTTTHQTTREVVETHCIDKSVVVEHVNIEKEIVNTQVIYKEQLNYVYNIENRNVFQPVSNVGTIINTIA